MHFYFKDLPEIETPENHAVLTWHPMCRVPDQSARCRVMAAHWFDTGCLLSVPVHIAETCAVFSEFQDNNHNSNPWSHNPLFPGSKAVAISKTHDRVFFEYPGDLPPVPEDTLRLVTPGGGK